MSEPSPTNHCGSCTACCKLVGVEELAKPLDSWCAHCDKGRGCRIYEERPPSCRGYACSWLAAREAGQAVDDALRPDRCHVVFHRREGDREVMAHVDPARPDAWRAGAAMRMIADIASSGTPVMVRAGKLRVVVEAGGIHLAERCGTRPDGTEEYRKGRRVGSIASVGPAKPFG